MKRLFFAGISLLALALPAARAQEVWGLARCVDHALTNNISLRQADLTVQQSQIALIQSEYNRHPNLVGGASANLNLGRSVNPFTNQFESNTILSNNFFLQSNATLYAGGRLNNTIAQNKVNVEAAEKDREQRGQDLALNVATAYLQVLFNIETLESAKIQLATTQEQLARTRKLVAAGTLPQANIAQIEAQIATEELSVVNATNNVELAKVSLMQLMNLDPGQPFAIERPEIADPAKGDLPATLEEVYRAALQNQPGLAAANARQRSAAIGVDLARAGKLPTVSASGSATTGYSSTAQGPTGDYRTDTLIQTVYIEGLSADIKIPQRSPIYERQGYFNQLSNFGSMQVGLSVSVPIYDRRLTRNNVAQANIAVENSRLQVQLLEQQLRQTIQQAYVNASAAYSRFAATQKQVQALEAALRNTEKQYEFGVANSLDYLQAKNTLNRSRFDLVQAKYEHLFRLKILDFYLGKELKL